MNKPLSYFDLQAAMGTTKHMGGFDSTRELVERLEVNPNDYLLDVGCGAGATACYLAKTYECRVMAVDLRQAMLDLAKKRAERMELSSLIEFRLADVKDLPFEDQKFDAVLCESVLTFVDDRAGAIAELARVTAINGRVGLNEQYWRQEPTQEMLAFVKRTWEIQDLPTLDSWERVLRQAGLKRLSVEPRRIDARREASQLQRYHAAEIWGMFTRIARLYISSAEFRRKMRDQQRPPRGLFDRLGYALIVGTR